MSYGGTNRVWNETIHPLIVKEYYIICVVIAKLASGRCVWPVHVCEKATSTGMYNLKGCVHVGNTSKGVASG